MKTPNYSATINSNQKGVNRSLKGNLFSKLNKEKSLWFLVLPGLLWYIIFCYIPMGGIIIAFKNYSPYRGIFASQWVGLKWFGQFFSSQFAGRLIKNTLLISLYSIIFGFPIPILIAILFNEIQHMPYKKLSQTISYLPHFISTVVIVGMVVNFLSPTGIVNNLRSMMGKGTINFMVRPEWFRTIYVASGIWQSAGWNSIIYISAIGGIDPELYEAATVDGASRWKQVLHVTIPSILPTIIILLILNIGGILSVGYEKIILMYNPSTYETADVISSYVYRRGIGAGEFSYGTAVGLFSSAINFIAVVVTNRFSKRVSEIALW